MNLMHDRSVDQVFSTGHFQGLIKNPLLSIFGFNVPLCVHFLKKIGLKLYLFYGVRLLQKAALVADHFHRPRKGLLRWQIGKIQNRLENGES